MTFKQANTLGQYQLEILVHGQPVKMYTGANGETCIEGRMGSEFTLRLHNNSRQRVAFIPSVDGLSVMDGKRATPQSSGYLVEPGQYVDVQGWRISLQQVARFLFGALDKSYAAQMDKPDDIGVIGALVYREKPRVRMLHLTLLREESITKGGPESFGLSRSAGPGMGTSYGRRVTDQAQFVEFDREDSPAAVITVYYGDRECLIADHGISFREPAAVVTNGHNRPEAFEFCPAPPVNTRG